jgi:hypothetical protein
MRRCRLLPAETLAAACLILKSVGTVEGLRLRLQSPCLLLHGQLHLRGGASAVTADPCDFESTPCIGALQDFGALEQFYSSGDANEVFRRKLADLKGQYLVGYRPVKGDGNCFIRGYVFGLLEALIAKPPTEAAGFRGTYTAPQLLAFGSPVAAGNAWSAATPRLTLVPASVCRAGLLMAYYFTMIDGKSGLGYSSAAVEDFYNDIVNQVKLIEQV